MMDEPTASHQRGALRVERKSLELFLSKGEAHVPEDDHRARLDRLQGAADDAARQVRNVYLTFLLVSVYIALIIGSTTDEQLLRGSDVHLPVLNVGLPIIGVYALVPFLYLVLHFNLLLQIYLLSRKLFALDVAINELPSGFDRAEQRGLLYPLPIARRLLPGWHSQFESWMIGVLALLTVVLLPIAILGGAQLRFLPFHSEGMTLWHRVIVVIDLILTWVFWPIIVTRQGGWTEWFKGIIGIRAESWLHRVSMGFNALISLIFVFVSGVLFVVPGSSDESWSVENWTIGQVPDSWKANDGQSLALTHWLFDRRDAWLHRNLRLAEATLVKEEPPPELLAAYHVIGQSVDEAWKDHAKGLVLVDRDLRFAEFFRADLINADFRGAKLQGASLSEAKLQGTNFMRAELQGANLEGANLRGANLQRLQLQGANLKRVQLQGANLQRAELQGADLSWAELQGADLSGAELQGADLSDAALQGANLNVARLHGADLNGATLDGANLVRAQLQGANLSDAWLNGVDLRQASLQGANLSGALLLGANVRFARLQGAILHSSDLEGADLRGASFWNAEFDGAILELSDTRGIEFTPLTGDELIALKEEVASEISNHPMQKAVLQRMEERLGSDEISANTLKHAETPDQLIFFRDDIGDVPDWPKSMDDVEYDKQLTSFLIDIACGDEYVTKGIARRALVRNPKKDRGRALYPDLAAALLKSDCEGGAMLPDDTRVELARFVERAEKRAGN